MKSYLKFLNENILENEITRTDTLLKSIEAERVYMGDVLGFNSEKFSDIEVLSKDEKFLNSLNKKNLKKNNIEYSRECETFLEHNLDLKFFLIFNEEDSELAKPEYIVVQSKPIKSYTWNQIKIYKVGGNIRKFYDTLTNKTIEIKDGNRNYIYVTSNAGKDWTLQNIENKNNEFKVIMSDDEIKSILSQKKISVEEVQ